MPNILLTLGKVKDTSQKDGKGQCPQYGYPAQHNSDGRHMLTDSGNYGKQKTHLRAEPFTSPETVRKTEDGGAINN